MTEAEGPPRKTRNYRNYSGMNSQNERYRVHDDEFFWLENVMRTGPRILKSVPGPKQLATFPQIVPRCPEDTQPGQQQITDGRCYHYNTGIPAGTLTGQCAGQLSFVAAGPEFYATVGNQDAFGTDYATNTGLFGPFAGVSPMFQIIHQVGGVLTTIPQIPLLQPLDHMTVVTQAAQFGNEGKSDGNGYEIAQCQYSPHGGGGAQLYNGYFDIDHQTIAFFYIGGAYPNIGGNGYWAKQGDFYWVCDQGPDATKHGIYKWQVSTGIGTPLPFPAQLNPPLLGPVGPANPDGLHIFSGIQATASHLWAWWYHLPDGSIIYKMDYDGNVLQTFVLNITALLGPPPILGYEIPQFHVVDDTLIYILVGQTSDWKIIYLTPGDGTLHFVSEILSANIPNCVATDADFNNGMNQFIFRNGCFFLSYGGFSFGTTDVQRYCTLFCPGSNVPIGTQ